MTSQRRQCRRPVNGLNGDQLLFHGGEYHFGRRNFRSTQAWAEWHYLEDPQDAEGNTNIESWKFIYKLEFRSVGPANGHFRKVAWQVEPEDRCTSASQVSSLCCLFAWFYAFQKTDGLAMAA
jgi:hypothetical protein